MVNVGQVVGGRGELLRAGVTDVAQRVESAGDEDGRRQAGMGVGVQGA
jgi:hypothetical protein